MKPFAQQPRVAVVGSGAVGGYFGGMLARAGVPVVLIGRASFVEAVNHSGLQLDTLQFKETVHPRASTDPSAVAGAEIVFFSVKTVDTARAARQIAPALSRDAIVVSLQNGVNNAEEIRAASGIEALPAVVYVAASVPAPGCIKHVGRGDLVVGPENERTRSVASLCLGAQIPCRIAEYIEGELWTKLIWNCALNAVSALGRVTYGEILRSADARQVLETVVQEVLDVAQAKGIRPAGIEDLQAAIAGSFKIAEQMSQTRSSTAQDLARGKRTEIDALNGYVAKLGVSLHVPTPANHALYTLVKLQEASFPVQE